MGADRARGETKEKPGTIAVSRGGQGSTIGGRVQALPGSTLGTTETRAPDDVGSETVRQQLSQSLGAGSAQAASRALPPKPAQQSASSVGGVGASQLAQTRPSWQS